MGVSEVLLWPYRYLEDIIVKLEELKIHSASIPGSW